MGGFKADSQRSEARILVIDDEAAVLRVVADGLEALGHKVWTADSGEDGLKKFERIRVDVVLCDLSMLDMDGLEVGRRIRDLSELSGSTKPTFLILTGMDSLTDDLAGPEGVDGFVTKPVALSQLGDTIERCMGAMSVTQLRGRDAS